MTIKISGKEMNFLYEDIQSAIDRAGLVLSDFDEEVIKGLNPNKPLRDYQIEALKYTNHYYNNLLRNKQIHLLYHMATGSGKTIIMAALILYFYKKGYRTFIFFVNSGNIIEKTKDNFLNKYSSKYLFADEIILDGKNTEIQEINNFDEIDNSKINIMFTTVQKLHQDIQIIKENQISLKDFENNKVILLADEAHHLNSETKRKKNKKEEETWEGTVHQILACNKDSGLFEFTATPDFNNELVIKRDIDKVIYNYDLLKFRKDGFTKDFDNYQSNNDDIHRLLLALLLSQYRKKLFAKNKIDVKPVVLAKAKTTDERNKFLERYIDFLNNKITENDIKLLSENAEGYAKAMFKYFESQNISYKDIIDEIKLDFNEEHIISLDSKMSVDILNQKNKLVNDLENPNNPYRLVVVVDMLHEGWDVLNLYDIVRLYEERDSGRKIGNATTQEAQLIGRGVRYYPFYFNDEQKEIFNKRKYDDDITNELRFCETLLFHSKTDSKYLHELREALKQQGMDIEDNVEFEYKLKESFKASDLYNQGMIFVNKQKTIENIADKVPENFKFILDKNFLEEDIQSSLVDDTSSVSEVKKKSNTFKITVGEFAKNNYPIIYKAMRNTFIAFDTLKGYIPGIKSSKDFIMNEKYIGNFSFTITTNNEIPTTDEYYQSFLEFFYKLRKEFNNWKEATVGTNEFYPISIKTYIKDTKRKIIHPEKYGEGTSQNDIYIPDEYKLDLSKCDWFVYNDNFGTTEEKRFVKYFSTIVKDIKKQYDEVYLIRNERNIHIYSFNPLDGSGRFEPDYILLLKKNKKDKGFIQKQVYIEPKGEQLIDKDSWKEDFMLQLNEMSKLVIYKNMSNNSYLLYGLPFYNHDINVADFERKLNEIISDETDEKNNNIIINDFEEF